MGAVGVTVVVQIGRSSAHHLKVTVAALQVLKDEQERDGKPAPRKSRAASAAATLDTLEEGNRVTSQSVSKLPEGAQGGPVYTADDKDRAIEGYQEKVLTREECISPNFMCGDDMCFCH